MPTTKTTGRAISASPTESIDIIVRSTYLEKDQLADEVKKSSKNTKRKQGKKRLFDVTGLEASSMIWQPFYRDLTQEEFKIVSKNYRGTKHVDRDGCYVCAIHPSCTHVIKKYK
jgi:hypothetical protein